MERGRNRRLLTILAVILGPASTTAIALSDSPRSNPIVHDYFRQRLIESLSTRDDHGRRVHFIDPVMLERQADGLAALFERDVYSKLRTMRAQSSEVEEARSGASREATRLLKNPESLVRWSGLFKRISDEAGDLLGMLRPVIGEVERKTNIKSETSSGGTDSGLDSEMQLLDDDINLAAERITLFLQGKDLTISLEELRGEGMLTLLQRVRARAREMSRRIESAG